MKITATLIPLLIFPVLTFGAPEADTDGDGLSDFAETHKYFTNPAKADSDGNGKPDGDWNERREYSYSIRTVVRVMKPYDLRSMNDDYQDARLLRETAEFGEFEVIHYPLNTLASVISANANWQRDYAAMQEWLRPGITTNWTPAMREKLLAELSVAGIEPDKLTDRELAEKVSRWMNDTCRYPGYMYTTAFMEFTSGKPKLLAGCEAAYEREKGAFGWSFEEQLQHEVFGAGMFEHKTRGTCSSTAIYWNTIFRALGLPSRQVFCIPAVDANDPAQLEMVRRGITHHGVRKTMLAGLEPLKGNSAHGFNEVFVGGRWVRLNYTNLAQNILDRHSMGLMTHLITFSDRSEVDFSRAWGLRYAQGLTSAEFPTANPYRALEVNDHFGAHAKVENPPDSPQVEHTNLTIKRAYWLRSAEKPGWVDTSFFARIEPDAIVAILHPAEYFPEQDYGQYGRFLRKTDRAFALRAPGQPDIAAQINRGFITVDRECAIALAIPKTGYAKLKPGVAYQLVPANGKPEAQWAVKEGVTLTSSGAFTASAAGEAPLISSAYWWDTLPPDDWRRSGSNKLCAWRDTSGKKHLLLHADLPADCRTTTEALSFLRNADPEFFLVNGTDRLPVKVSDGAAWRGSSGQGFELEVVLEPETFAALKPGKSYTLEPRNTTGPHWAVSAAASVRRQ